MHLVDTPSNRRVTFLLYADNKHMDYTKPHLSIEEQIILLKKRFSFDGY